jgi:hypothetical protein
MRKMILVHLLFLLAAAGAIATMDFGFAGDLHDAGWALLEGSSAALAFLWVV